MAALKTREIALPAARRHCQEMEVQFLDQSVSLGRIWLKRAADNKVRIWRSYQFEFTATGDQRYRGQVVMLGNAVEFVQLEPHRIN